MHSTTKPLSRICKIWKNQNFGKNGFCAIFLNFLKTEIYVIEDISMSKCCKFQVDIFGNDRVMSFSRSQMATFHDNFMHSDEFWTF